METPTAEPSVVTAGDRIKWERELPDYPASDGWVLTYALRNAAGKIDIASTASGSKHVVNVAPDIAPAWVPGDYQGQGYVTKAATNERYTVVRWSVRVLPNLAAQNGAYDSRAHAEKVLASIEAVIEKRATKDQEEYAINGRSLKRTPVADLIHLRNYYRSEVARLKRAEKRARGKRATPSLRVRL